MSTAARPKPRLGDLGLEELVLVKLTQNTERETWARVNGAVHWNNSVTEKIINHY